MNQSIETIRKLIQPLLKQHGVIRASIFGSLARNQMKDESDIDILVELPKEKSLFDFIALKLELEEVLGSKVDLVEYSTIHPLLKDRILSEQVPVT
jgi:uncharacterized protein